MDGEIELKTYFLARKADMVEVVRCKNCQHQDDLQFEVGGKFVCRKGHGWNTNDFFCADGEPRKQEFNETDGSRSICDDSKVKEERHRGND